MLQNTFGNPSDRAEAKNDQSGHKDISSNSVGGASNQRDSRFPVSCRLRTIRSKRPDRQASRQAIRQVRQAGRRKGGRHSDKKVGSSGQRGQAVEATQLDKRRLATWSAQNRVWGAWWGEVDVNEGYGSRQRRENGGQLVECGVDAG